MKDVKQYTLKNGDVYTIPIPEDDETPLCLPSLIILELMEENKNLEEDVERFRAANTQLNFMLKNGLGEENMKDDILPMHEM